MTRDDDRGDALLGRLRASVTVPPLSRRSVLGLGGAAAAAALASAPFRAFAADPALPEITSVPASLKGSGQVVVATWGGIGTDMQRKAIFEPFEKLTGIKVVEATGPDPAKVKAMVETRTVQWDVCQLGRGTIIELNNQGSGDYWEKIDYSLVSPDVTEEFRHPLGVDMLPFAQVIVYRKDVYPDGPKGWADFFDTARFPGPRTLPIASKGNIPELAGALIADGVPPEKIYPIDIDRAFKSLTRIKPKVVKWWETGAQPMQMLVDKEAHLATAWNGRVAAAQKDGVPLEIVWNGGTLLNNAWVVPKGAPNLANAQKFIAFSTMAVPQARYSMLLPYGFTNRKAVDYIPANILAQLPTAPDNQKQLVAYDYDWWGANRPKVIELFNKWVLS